MIHRLILKYFIGCRKTVFAIFKMYTYIKSNNFNNKVADVNKLKNKIKELRNEHSWSQAQLSEIAGISIRTVQRIENTGKCSKESLLAIASAFDIEVKELTEIMNENTNDYDEINLCIFSKITGYFENKKKSKVKTAILSIILAMPAIYFFSANILKYYFGISFLASPLDYFYSSPEILYYFNFYSPIIFIGGLTASVFLNIISVFNLRLFKNNNSLIGNFIFKRHISGILMIGLNSIILFSMIGYILLENL